MIWCTAIEGVNKTWKMFVPFHHGKSLKVYPISLFQIKTLLMLNVSHVRPRKCLFFIQGVSVLGKMRIKGAVIFFGEKKQKGLRRRNK
jgi:hypothetical protein